MPPKKPLNISSSQSSGKLAIATQSIYESIRQKLSKGVLLSTQDKKFWRQLVDGQDIDLKKKVILINLWKKYQESMDNEEEEKEIEEQDEDSSNEAPGLAPVDDNDSANDSDSDPDADFEGGAWYKLNNDLERVYGHGKIPKIPGTEKDRLRIFKFIETTKDEDEKFLANLWLQKFDSLVAAASKREKLARKKAKISKNDSLDKSRAPLTKKKVSSQEILTSNTLTFAGGPQEPMLIDSENFCGNLSAETYAGPPVIITDSIKETWKKRFYDCVAQMYSYDPAAGEQNRCPVPNVKQYQSMLDACAGRIIGRSLTSREYDYRKKLVLQKIAGIEYVVKTSDLQSHEQQHGVLNNFNCPKICPMNQLFDAVYDSHIATGHAAISRTHKNTATRYSNIPESICSAFCGLCPVCARNKLNPSRKATIEPILSKTFNDRGQIDLIDMQSAPDGPFNWILHYQDHLTKFSYLRPLRKKTATAVAWELYQIFTTQGCPLILQHDNGREFVNQVITRLKRLWPGCVIVRGRPRHPQTQGSVERANADVEGMLGKWMYEHKATQWSVGIYKVAHDKNNRWHRTIKSTPYELLYGQKTRVDMKDLPIPLDVIRKLKDEAELMDLLGFPNPEELDASDRADMDAERIEAIYDTDEDLDNEVPGLMSKLVIDPLTAEQPGEIEHSGELDNASAVAGNGANVEAGTSKQAEDVEYTPNGVNVIERTPGGSFKFLVLRSLTDPFVPAQRKAVPQINLGDDLGLSSQPLDLTNDLTNRPLVSSIDIPTFEGDPDTPQNPPVSPIPPDGFLHELPKSQGPPNSQDESRHDLPKSPETPESTNKSDNDSTKTLEPQKATTNGTTNALPNSQGLPPASLNILPQKRKPDQSSDSENENNQDYVDVKFFERKYVTASKAFGTDNPTTSKLTQCGCQEFRCYTSDRSLSCTFCLVPMSKNCVDSDMQGCCRKCYHRQYGNRGENDKGNPRSQENSSALLSGFDSPRRGSLRATASANQKKAGEAMKQGQSKEGNLPIPIGSVVTVFIDSVDRGHTDGKRLPGVVTAVTLHDDKEYYKVAVVGGLLTTNYLRKDLIHEYGLTPGQFGLTEVYNTWRSLPKISVRQGVKQISLTGGQGHVRCTCKSTCKTSRCSCFKAGRRCGSRCHLANSKCCNHDMEEEENGNDEDEDED